MSWKLNIFAQFNSGRHSGCSLKMTLYDRRFQPNQTMLRPASLRASLFRPIANPAFRLLALFAVLLSFTTASFAQSISAGMTGLVRDSKGKEVAGAEITAVHIPTGTTYTAKSNALGRFNFRSLIVGGPYSVSTTVAGFNAATLDTVSTELGSDVEVTLRLEPIGSEVVTLERFNVVADLNELDAAAMGAGSLLDSARLASKPTTQRSLADVISASPFVTLRSLSGDREEAQITALGQNNRYNSIQIDGSRINDQFGLNGTGLASFYNPLSLDTIEQLSVQVSPYDIRNSGFTGASINAVTKSGTNKFKGSAYYYFSGDHLWGVQTQGEDVNTRITTGNKVVPRLERTTYGFTFGGPILKDRVFFFLNYEKFERTAAPSQTGLSDVNAQDAADITSRLAAYNTASGKSIKWGTLGGTAANLSDEEKYLGKIDWNITKQHRASIRYSTTEGQVPQFGSYTSTSRTLTSVSPSLSASGVTAFDSHFYSQERVEKNLSATLLSQWTPDFKTELKYATVKQDQQTPTTATAPEVTVYGVRGLNRNGVAISTGAVVAGTEQFRQGNQIFVDTKQYSATGDYFLGNLILSGGLEREESDFINIFRQASYGLVNFASVADFLADTPARIERSFYDPAKRPLGDLSDFATNGVFGQVKWNVNPRLNIMAGIRYEFSQTEKSPAFNQALFTASGFDNTGTLDGQSYISPRVSFNLALDDERRFQVRGGAGHFLGRAPWVFFSNSYNNIGVGAFSRSTADAVNPLARSLTTFLRNDFDPANPIATGTDIPTLRREVNWSDKGIELPSVWRANIGVDAKLNFLNSTLSTEVVFTRIDQALSITNENIRATTIGADGRQRFAGNPAAGVGANARFAAFTDLYRIRNVSVGGSTYATLSWSRPMKDNWSFDLSYTRGRSTEAQAIGQTTASGQWQRNVIFNQGAVENGTSDFEVRDRVQLSLSRRFEFVKNWKTIASLYYEGRTGNPFSWIYQNDLNGDGQANDAVAVPSGPSDPRFDFSSLQSLDPALLQNYFAFIQSSGLGEYAGAVAPKNSFTQPWVNRLDLKFSQSIPIYKPVEVELFFDFINFGSFINDKFFSYYEEAFRATNDVFRRQFTGSAEYGPDGRIRPLQTTATATRGFFNPDRFVFDNGQSRWRVQFGARVKF